MSNNSFPLIMVPVMVVTAFALPMIPSVTTLAADVRELSVVPRSCSLENSNLHHHHHLQSFFLS